MTHIIQGLTSYIDKEVVNYAQANEENTIFMFQINIAYDCTAFPSLPLHCTNHKSYRGKGKSQCSDRLVLVQPTQTQQFTIIGTAGKIIDNEEKKLVLAD